MTLNLPLLDSLLRIDPSLLLTPNAPAGIAPANLETAGQQADAASPEPALSFTQLLENSTQALEAPVSETPSPAAFAAPQTHTEPSKASTLEAAAIVPVTLPTTLSFSAQLASLFEHLDSLSEQKTDTKATIFEQVDVGNTLGHVGNTLDGSDKSEAIEVLDEPEATGGAEASLVVGSEPMPALTIAPPLPTTPITPRAVANVPAPISDVKTFSVKVVEPKLARSSTAFDANISKTTKAVDEPKAKFEVAAEEPVEPDAPKKLEAKVPQKQKAREQRVDAPRREPKTNASKPEFKAAPHVTPEVHVQPKIEHASASIKDEVKIAASGPSAPVALTDTPAVKSSPAREIVLQVPAGNNTRVEVHLLERNGAVHINVRTSDQGLNDTLRAHLDQLVQTITKEGFHIETWNPAETRPDSLSAIDSEPTAPIAATSQAAQAGGTEDNTSQDRRQRPMERWLEEFERRLEE